MDASLNIASVGASLLAIVGMVVAEVTPRSLPGGYAMAKVDKDVKAAADFAVKQQSLNESEPLMLQSISQAEKQIVAGLNYRLVLIVKRGATQGKVRAVVFRDLSSQYSLKSWEWLDR